MITTFLSRVEPAGGPAARPAGRTTRSPATIFLGVPERQVTRLRGSRSSAFATVDRFDGPPFAG